MEAKNSLIRDGRERLGISQTKAAEMLGVSRPYYNRLEQGHESPSLPLASEIVQLYSLKVSPLDLVGDGRREFWRQAGKALLLSQGIAS